MMQLPILPAPTTANLVYPDMSRHYPLCGGSRSIGDLQPRLFLSCFPSFLLPNPSQVGRSSASF